ncbi:hypothetical protein BH09MYX1_BH09MYX1_07970 [soil metagenome]
MTSYQLGTSIALTIASLAACTKDTRPSEAHPSSSTDLTNDASAPIALGDDGGDPRGRASADAAIEPVVASVPESEAASALFPSNAPQDCNDPGRVTCLIGRLYATDPAARDLALDMYRDSGDVAGLERPFTMNGGFRGQIQIVPELPVGKYRDRLAWVASSVHDFDEFFRDLRAAAGADAGTPHYRWRALTVKFFRSVNRTTPSAFASPWTFSFNVEGSLLRTETGVRETLFHEIFHMDDFDHGNCSPIHFSAYYDAILKKCGPKIACLDPYAPNDTRVIGGTYYAFQQENGVPVHEYAAELALRYYKEHRAFLHHEKPPFPKAFKCGPPENARSWNAIVAEFFGGIDLIPACP